MEEEINYRKETEKAMQSVEGKPLSTDEASLSAYQDICCGSVLIAEQDLQDQDNEWEIAGLARRVLFYATQLVACDYALDTQSEVVRRMVQALSDHPRLELKLLRLWIEIVQKQGKQEEKKEKLSNTLETIALLERNIALADNGEAEKAEQRGYLKRDPIEWTQEWEDVIDDVDRVVYHNLRDQPRGMGFCHGFWHERYRVMKTLFNMDWRSPAVMNPRVLFD